MTLAKDEKYQKYLCSREWNEKKEAVKKRAYNLCERCFCRPIQSTHHLTYIRIYNEKLSDLLGLCDLCHSFISGTSDKDPIFDNRMEIYLAGKVGTKEKRGYKWELAKLAYEKYPIEFFSTDGNSHSEHLLGNAMYDLRYDYSWDIENGFVNTLRMGSCRGSIAYIDSPDSYGTIAELSFHSAIISQDYCDFPSKSDLLPINVIFEIEKKYKRSKLQQEYEMEFFDKYWFMCSFPLIKVWISKNKKESKEIFLKISHMLVVLQFFCQLSEHERNLRMEYLKELYGIE